MLHIDIFSHAELLNILDSWDGTKRRPNDLKSQWKLIKLKLNVMFAIILLQTGRFYAKKIELTLMGWMDAFFSTVMILFFWARREKLCRIIEAM